MADRPAKKKPTEHTRAGRVAILGRPNVGKSTLLNAALDQPLSIVSPTPQTTRDAILGIVRHGDAEIALVDTPGLHKAGSALGRAMNRSAREAGKAADVVVFVAEVPPVKFLDKGATVHTGDAALLADIPAETPVVLVLNKVDLAKKKDAILPLLTAFGALRDFAAIVPISALRGGKGGIGRVLDEVAKLCPEGPHQHDEDEITDRPVRFFAAEYVREQILRATKEEVPHAVAVEVTEFREPGPPRQARAARPGAPPQKEAVVRIEATIHVERPGQKKILVGTKAEMLKRIGTEARKRIEELLGRRVHLQLFVRVTADWRDSPQQLAELGYQTPRTKGATPAVDADGDAS